MRRNGRFRRGRKRSVSWVDGITTYGAAENSRLITLTQAGFAANQWGATTGAVVASDLPFHGGEDAVVTRVVGRLGFMEGRRNAGAGLAATGYQLRVVVAQVPTEGATIFSEDFTTSAGLGSEKILWFRDVIVSATAIGATGGGYDTAFTSGPFWTEVDVSAKRKVQQDSTIIVWYQTVFPGGTSGADFRLLGGLRTLLMRPR